jgi:hypothetical protein
MGILLMAISRRHEENQKAASVARPTVLIDFATHFLYGDEGDHASSSNCSGFRDFDGGLLLRESVHVSRTKRSMNGRATWSVRFT